MLRKYRNALWEEIRNANLDARKFRLEDEDTANDQRAYVYVGDSELKFGYRMHYVDGQRRFEILASRTYERSYPKPIVKMPAPSGIVANFDELKLKFREWLNDQAKRALEDQHELEEDRSLPDLWAELDLGIGITPESPAFENTRFSDAEQKRVSESLNQIKNEIEAQKVLDGPQLKLLSERLEYLAEASKRIGRKDWLMAAAGAIIGFTLQVGLSPEVGSQIINVAGKLLLWISSSPKLLM